jgi:hypothetical protein
MRASTQHRTATMEAFRNGATIEYINFDTLDDEYTETSKPDWNWDDCNYRVKEKSND